MEHVIFSILAALWAMYLVFISGDLRARLSRNAAYVVIGFCVVSGCALVAVAL